MRLSSATIAILSATFSVCVRGQCTDEFNTLTACLGVGGNGDQDCSVCRAESAEEAFNQNGFATDCESSKSSNCRLLTDCATVCSCLDQQIALGVCQSNEANDRSCVFSKNDCGSETGIDNSGSETGIDSNITIATLFGPDDLDGWGENHAKCAIPEGRVPQISTLDVLDRGNCGFPNRKKSVYNCNYETPDDLEFRLACSSAGGEPIEYKSNIPVGCLGDGLNEFYGDDGIEEVGVAHYLKPFRECYSQDDRACSGLVGYFAGSRDGFKDETYCEVTGAFMEKLSRFLEEQYLAAGYDAIYCFPLPSQFYKCTEETTADTEVAGDSGGRIIKPVFVLSSAVVLVLSFALL